MPRVISGMAKGRKLRTVAGNTVRPTGDRMKQSLFDVLRPRMPGAMVVDLCAGSGALGIEALSQGAAFCTFVEPDRQCRQVIEQNLAATELASYARVLPMSAFDAIRVLAAEANNATTLVLADPPYTKTELAVGIVQQIAAHGLLLPGGVLSVERPRAHGLPMTVNGLEFWQEKPFGRAVVVLYLAPEATG